MQLSIPEGAMSLIRLSTSVCSAAPVGLKALSSEVVDLFVGVEVGRLHEHLLGLASIFVLLLHFDASVHCFRILLLGTHLAVENSLLFRLVLRLEVALSLQVSVGALALESVHLADEAGRVWTCLMVQERVWMSGLRSESSGRNKFYRSKAKVVS